MNYGKKGMKQKIKSISSKKKKYTTKIFLSLFKLLLLSSVFIIVFIGTIGLGMVQGILQNAPDVESVSIVPSAVASTVYDATGNPIERLVTTGSNREPVPYEQVPEDLINAILAIEDERFWTHNGIDVRGIIRAGVRGLSSKDFSEGASTITQQLIKNSVFEGGFETSFGEKVERKLQEQYLALEVEKTMDKKIILQHYLNTINLGNNTLGVQFAAKRYFNKDVSELTLSECVVLAGITQNPTQLNPITHPDKNADRRLLVINNMIRQGYITEEQKTEILADDVYDRIQVVNAGYEQASSPYSYFNDELIEQVLEDLQKKKGYSPNSAHNLLYSGGLQIYTTQDPRLQQIVDEELANPENFKLFQYSIAYRLSVVHEDGSEEHFSELDIRNYNKNVLGNTKFNSLYNNTDEVEQAISAFKGHILRENDRILGENYTATVQPQTSFVLMEQSTGYVKAISGGRGPKTASLTLNRATNTVRQPGSVFKTLVAFAPALDTSGATLGTVYYDAPFSVGSKSIANWWNSSNGYMGYSNIRQGIVFSMNIVATKTLLETVTPQLGFEYGENFGITSLEDGRTLADGSVKSDLGAAIALGGLTDGVSNLELTAAYAAIANAGVYTKPIFYTKILDLNGKIILDNEPETRRVIKESTAFLLTDALAGSMASQKIYGASISSTGTASAIPNMSNAGKSGTTTGNNDIWFVGYTPYYSAGIWAGFDENQKIPSGNGNTSFHKTIWRKIMTRAHEGLPNPGFTVPDSIEQASICIKSGKKAIDGVCENDPRGSAVYTEYFAKGTIPSEMCDHHVKVVECQASNLPVGDYCPESSKISKIYTVVPENGGATNDSALAMPAGYLNRTCDVHLSPVFEDFSNNNFAYPGEEE